MARIRSVHPGLATDARFVVLSDAAQIFYVLLLTVADDAGVFRWEPLELRMQLRPASTNPVEPLLDELCAGNFLRRFEAGGHAYGAVRNFRRFQSPKSPHQRYPLPANLCPYVGLDPDHPDLTVEQKRQRIASALMAQPELSNRAIGRLLRVDHKTVATVRAEMAGGELGGESGGEFPTAFPGEFPTKFGEGVGKPKTQAQQNQSDKWGIRKDFPSTSEALPQRYPLDREWEWEKDKEKERESLVDRTSLLPREAEPDTATRPSPKSLKKFQESEVEPPPRQSEAPEGWLAEAEAARDEAGLEPVNLPLEWAKFAARAEGPVERRRWIEWSLRAWVAREPQRYAGGTRGFGSAAEAVAETPWAARMRQWHREGWWLPAFGPRPGEPGCFVPAQYLAEAAE
jgi:hypothetical protein